MIKHIKEVKQGQFFEAFQATYYKRCKAFSVKVRKNGTTRLVHNSGINYVDVKA